MVENSTKNTSESIHDVESPSKVLAMILADGSLDDLLKPIAGHPLLAYSLAAVFQAQTVGHVLLIGDTSLKEVVDHYASLMDWDEDEIEIISRPAYLQSSCSLEEYALEKGKEWLFDQEDTHIDMIACVFADWPLHPNGSFDEAVKCLREHKNAEKTISLVPTSPLKHLWSTSKDGLVSQAAFTDSGQEIEQLYTETRHFKITRLAKDLDPERIVPFIINPQFDVNGLTIYGRDLAEWLIQFSTLDLIFPGHRPRKLPKKVSLLVMDFDGVLSDNRVWVDEFGHEQIAANRSDSLGLAFLRQAGIDALVISMETNPVVSARCKKMKVPVLQGILDKATILKQYFSENSIDPQEVVYLGNDVNDLPCFPLVACAVAVADSHPMVLRRADHILTHHGGHAAVRELCDLLIYRNNFDPTNGL